MNKSHTLNASILPILILVGLILGAGYFLIGSNFKLPKFGQKDSLQRLEGYPTVINITKEDAATIGKIREVITSQEQLDAFLAKVSKGGLTVNEEIDFSKKVVIAVATTFDEPDKELKIKKVYESSQDKKLTIQIRNLVPEDICPTGEKYTVGIDLATVKKTDWKIDFENITEKKPCNNE